MPPIEGQQGADPMPRPDDHQRLESIRRALRVASLRAVNGRQQTAGIE